MKRYTCALFSLLVVFATAAAAQDKPKDAKAPAAKPAASAAPAAKPAAASEKKVPDDFKLNMLIRSTIIAINQANKTGNYSVVRDLSAPGFKQTNSVEKLAEIFAGLRNTKFDLSPILFYSPKLVKKPGLMENGMLRLTGFFDTRPQRVNFDLAFEDNQGEWLLYGVSLGTRLVPAASAQAGPPAPAGAAAPAPAAGAAPAASASPTPETQTKK